MVRVAVTGGIACGKSSVIAIMRDHGFAACDADEFARDVMGTREVIERVVGLFGPSVLCSDGTIDRRALGGMVFSSSEALAKLNEAVHPGVRDRLDSWLACCPSDRAAVEVPLLYEACFDDGWSAVVCVAASRRTQIERLMSRGLSEGEAVGRIEAQMAVSRKMVMADNVVYNDWSREALLEQVGRVMRAILEK